MYPKISMRPTRIVKNSKKPDRAAPARRTGGRRIQVCRSGVHGKGVYAVSALAKAEVVIEYTGEIITWSQAQRRHPHNPHEPDHTFYFHIDDKRVIDANRGGNSARWINHSCHPNCEADEIDGRIFIKTLRRIPPGAELFYDYGLIIDDRYTPKLKRRFECRCGASTCRRTMLAPKR